MFDSALLINNIIYQRAICNHGNHHLQELNIKGIVIEFTAALESVQNCQGKLMKTYFALESQKNGAEELPPCGSICILKF